MKVVQFPYGNVTAIVTVNTVPRDWGAYWASVETGQWEPNLFFAVFSALTRLPLVPRHWDGGQCLDIGSWIGPTVLFTSHFCDEVFAIDADPSAIRQLVVNVALNP